jgi:hypothetical protein
MITIDGKEYKKEQMTEEQVKIFQKINQLDQKKKSFKSELEDLDTLIDIYIGKFKNITIKK